MNDLCCANNKNQQSTERAKEIQREPERERERRARYKIFVLTTFCTLRVCAALFSPTYSFSNSTIVGQHTQSHLNNIKHEHTHAHIDTPFIGRTCVCVCQFICVSMRAPYATLASYEDEPNIKRHGPAIVRAIYVRTQLVSLIIGQFICNTLENSHYIRSHGQPATNSKLRRIIHFNARSGISCVSSVSSSAQRFLSPLPWMRCRVCLFLPVLTASQLAELEVARRTAQCLLICIEQSICFLLPLSIRRVVAFLPLSHKDVCMCVSII